VLCVRRAGHALPLTGHIKLLGLECLLRLAPRGCDVLTVFRKYRRQP
jgi:hypothetical protein